MEIKKKLSEDELRWRAEEDARTLERYQEIVKDKKRLDAALKKAKEQIDNLKGRAEALGKSISGLKNRK